ncbi:methylated-DNA--[protein]-cysteine S-methyltransferase [Halobacteriovorax sp. JY17]|uniref:methylated-DNA--[protein]-cysteine S-methyltransferase n=1 Tax=Halobacteriovorax sp. JY17 TaxID=2014617 RepID=UPI000C473591|nr:methylated-DNA--[protein]-cysteine S-methyltransferase [Halobacteriovorax sp. JY17]PIK16631.1 MAG: cysteine methyltransferase [Halobacteriovorax sp. JY17]
MDAILSTKLGKFYIQYSSKGLSLLSFTIPRKVESSSADQKFIKTVTKELNDYADGKLKKFSIKLDLEGTEFQKSVWKQLQKIKYGEVKSYGEIAKAINLEGGQRAVGGANNKNRIPIIIPCHRVIKSDGGLGGYAGGLRLKEKLLAIEGVAINI